jgi:hypothetical protein
MKVYINGYKNHWISPYTIVEYVFFWTDWSKCGRSRGIIDDIKYVERPNWANKLADRLAWISNTIKWVGDKFDHKINYVKIDRYDTWSMDHTLAYIIVPMLKQLQATKHGSPMIDDEDVPVHLQSAGYKKSKKNKRSAGNRSDIHAISSDNDDTIHERWDWALNEMIWAFEQKTDDDAEDKFWDHSETNGSAPWDENYIAPKCDWDGLRAHQDRMQNGFRLFGKYYSGLWD